MENTRFKISQYACAVLLVVSSIALVAYQVVMIDDWNSQSLDKDLLSIDDVQALLQGTDALALEVVDAVLGSHLSLYC